MRLYLDLETRNTYDIDNPLYKETAEILLFIYAFGDSEAKCWDCTDGSEMPPALRISLEKAEQGLVTILTFNGRPFDMSIIRHRYGYRVPEENQIDIRDVALRYCLPASLGKLTAVVGLAADEQKDKRGGYLIDLFCGPLANIKSIKKEAPYDLAFIKSLLAAGRVFCEPEDAPELWQDFIVYGIGDVESMRAAHNKMPTWNDTDKEQLLCAINHRINERGLRIDVDYASRMAQLVAEYKTRVADSVMDYTGGIKITSRAKFKAWVQAQLPGRDVPNTAKDTIERLTKEGDLPPVVAKVFELYGQSSSSSTAKYAKMVETAHPDTDRIHWYIDIRGAGTTGRYGAKGGIQVHNFPRPNILPWVIEHQRGAVMAGRRPKNLLRHAPSMLRQAIIPDPGHIFVNADLSSIEGRTMAWGSGFERQVQDYAGGVNAYFANGPMFGVSYDEMAVFKDSQDPVEYGMYMLGKVSELSMLYYGGVTALVGMGRNYGMPMGQIADMLYAEGLIPEQKMYEAEKCWNFVRLTARGRRAVDATRLSKQQWKVLDSVKRLWRDRHMPIVSFWYEIQRSLLAAWLTPEEPVAFGFEGRSEMMFMGDWFGIKLPSGRILSYFGASVGGAEKAERIMDPDWTPDSEEENEDDPTDRPVLLYHSFDRSGQLSRKPNIAHSGVIANNWNQGFAASVLDEGLIRADAEGWNPVLHIHDQIVGHVRIGDTERTPKALEALMCRPLEYAPGLPLKAQGEYLRAFAK